MAVKGPNDVARPRALIRPWTMLLLAEQPTHGYDLVLRLRAMGFEWGTPGGPIYRELREMAQAGMARAIGGSPGPDGPRRRVYELTPEGLVELGRLVEAAGELSALSLELMARHGALDAKVGPGPTQRRRRG